MMLNESIKSTFEKAFELEEKIDALTTELKKAKATIRKYIEDANETKVNQDGYYAIIAEAVRDTLLTDEVEKLLGYKIPDACYKHTPYTTFKIKRMQKV